MSSHALEQALATLPSDLRKRLIKAYRELKAAWISRQYDLCGLRAGKFCETMSRVLEQVLTGSHRPFGQSIPNFAAACSDLERLPKASGPESLRVIMPRCLNFVYTLRNKRDVGHVAGDVDANEIDASTAVRNVDWCMSELIRCIHTLSLEEAQELLDSIAEREIVSVWAVGGIRRVLDHRMSRTSQVLVLLYGELDTAIPVEELAEWVEAPRLSDFKRDVLRPLHRRRLIEFDETTDTAILSPTGAKEAETILKAAD